MIYSMLNRSILASLFAISFSQAMEAEKTTTLRIDPKDIDNTDTIRHHGEPCHGFAPFNIINVETLKSMGNPDIQKLVLSPTLLPSTQQEFKFLFNKDVIETIFTNFPNLTYLDLSDNNITTHGMEYLLNQLRTNTKLVTLKLSNTGFCKSGPVFRTISDFPKDEKEPDIDHSGNSMPKFQEDDKFITLKEAQADPEMFPIYHLNGSISLTNYDANFMQHLLAENTSLKVLDLSNNAIEDKHLKIISSGFNINRTIQMLNLDRNRITETEAKNFEELTANQHNSFIFSIEKQTDGTEVIVEEGCVVS
jgi:hypothetical protein